jgi:hypothetical protein
MTCYALESMEEFVQLSTHILGNNHQNTLSPSSALFKWQAENFGISSVVEEASAR